MWHYEVWIHSPITSVGVVHSTWLSWTMWHMHAPTFNKWHKKKKKKKTLQILTHGAMRGCGLTSLMVCINDKICDIRERIVTIRSEMRSTNIRSLGFGDIREWVVLLGLILRSLEWNTMSFVGLLSIYFNRVSLHIALRNPILLMFFMGRPL